MADPDQIPQRREDTLLPNSQTAIINDTLELRVFKYFHRINPSMPAAERPYPRYNNILSLNTIYFLSDTRRIKNGVPY